MSSRSPDAVPQTPLAPHVPRALSLTAERATLAVPLVGAALLAAALSLVPDDARRALASTPDGARAAARVLRVCSDPNNLPFSNARGEGFENRIAQLVARELGAKLEYTWWAQRRGFVRNTLSAKECDVVMGLPSSMEMVRVTQPYYSSTYVFVSRRSAHHAFRTFDDAALRTLRVGVQLIGDDGANTPPGHALARRGIVQNVVGFSVYGDYSEPNPPARIVDAVAAGTIDVAIVWGPLAGYFAKRQPVPLDVVPVTPPADMPQLPFVYSIAMGVRKSDAALQRELDGVITRRRAEIDGILAEYGVPRVKATRVASAAVAGASR